MGAPGYLRTFFGVGDKGRGWSDYSIRRTVEWAQTDRGGLQMPMFSPLDEAAADGCMRWGMCETEAPEQTGVSQSTG